MEIVKNKFSQWCSIATAMIGFGPDRRQVEEELLAHMQDHYDELIAEGIPEKEACEKVLTSMGDAIKIAPQLAAIHRPFWGYMLRACKIALVVLLCLSILPIWNYFKDLKLQDTPSLRKYDIYNSASYGGDTGRTLLHISQPDISFTSDGSTFTLTDAVVCTSYSEYYGGDFTQLYVRIQQTCPLPWTEHDEYFLYYGITRWFSARDSLGNVYEGFSGNANPNAHHMYNTGVQSGIFTYTHECWINEFPADAEWVDICYERDGRDFSLRVYLTGGDGK